MVNSAQNEMPLSNEPISLLHSLDKYDDLLQLLLSMDKSGSDVSFNTLFFIEFKRTFQLMNELQIKTSMLQAQVEQLKKELDTNLQSSQQRLQCIEAKNEKVHQEYESINITRLSIIQEQCQALEAFKAARFVARLKKYIYPRLGNLYQYNPQPFSVPNKYNRTPLPPKPPSISIVTPSYNQGEYLDKTMASVLDQQYPNLEYIITDGGSNDDSVFIIKRHEKSLKHWESEKDFGQSHALNKGFQKATGEIMAYLNSDDLLMPGTLNYVANYFETHPDIDVVYGHRIIIDEYDQEIGRWVLPLHDDEILKWVDYIPQETMFWRRSIWDKAGGKIDESFNFAMDWDLLLRFEQAGAKFARLPRFMGAFRVHSQQKTSAKMQEVGLSEMEKLRRRYHGKRVSPQAVSRNTKAYLYKHLMYHFLYKLKIFNY